MTRCYWYHEYRDMNMTVPYCEELRIDNPHCENECSCKYYISKDDADNVIRNASAEPSGDLISREEVLALINKAMDTTDNKDIQDYIFCGLRRDVHNLPSANRPITKDTQCQKKNDHSGEVTEMVDLISRQEAIEIIASHDETNGTEKVFTGREITDLLASLPSADRPKGNSSEWVAEKEREFEELNRPKGEWLYLENEPYSRCSVCGAYIDDFDDDKYIFCPYCGAEMKGGQDE